MKLHIKSILYITLCCLFTQLTHAEDRSDEELNVYSARKEAYIKPLLDKFATQHNIQINLVTSKADALIQRLNNEGKNSPADVFITTDAGRLHRAKEAGLLQTITDQSVIQLAPEQYRDPEGYWLGLSVRVRAIIYSHERVKISELSSYENLAEPGWKNRICVRSSNNIYNQSLVASLIAHHGEEATQAWTNDFASNLARKPQGGDRDQVKAVATGQCDIALVNSYYLGNMIKGSEQEQAAASKVKLFWPNQSGRGAHVNISGIAITKHAKHVELANKLITFLFTKDAQSWYGDVNLEFPVIEGIETNKILKSWGPFKADTLNLGKLGSLNANAVQIMDRAKWR
ncbi:MAG: extracellular solute-binding protein [Gammaproteobacteria bacterium]